MSALPLLAVQHLGALHPMEQVLTLVLAFGPFAVLAAVIVHRRRHEAADTTESAADSRTTPSGTDP